MREMSGLERIITTLQLEEPDRVPHFEVGLDRKIKEKLCPEHEAIDFFDWDAACVDDRTICMTITKIEFIKKTYFMWRVWCEGVRRMSRADAKKERQPIVSLPF